MCMRFHLTFSHALQNFPTIYLILLFILFTMLSSKPNQDQIKILSTTNFMFKNFYSTFYRGCMNYLLKFVLNFGRKSQDISLGKLEGYKGEMNLKEFVWASLEKIFNRDELREYLARLNSIHLCIFSSFPLPQFNNFHHLRNRYGLRLTPLMELNGRSKKSSSLKVTTTKKVF